MSKILCVGGGGYVGTSLIEYLLAQGEGVRCLDCFVYRNNDSVADFLKHPRFELIKGDFCQKSTLEKAAEGVSDVVFLAGLVGDPITKKYPEESRLINEEGVHQALLQLACLKIRRLVFISTCSNYGLIPENEVADETYPLRPLSAYARAKVSAEELLISKQKQIPYEFCILRFATAFGISRRMRFDLTVSEFTRQIAAGETLRVFDPDTWRPYCHLKDFATLINLALKAPREKVHRQIFNAGGDCNNATKRQIVDLILKRVKNGKVEYQLEGGDPRNYRVNFRKIKTSLGFEPSVTIQQGIEELLQVLKDDKYTSWSLGNYDLFYPN